VVEVNDGTLRTARVLPLVVATVAVVISALIIVLQVVLSLDIWQLYVLGWLATPVAALLCVGWDAIGQRAGLADPWFDARPHYSLVLRFLAVVALVIGGYHIVRIGIAAGTAAVSAGWFA
jgi:hypothetical protein